MTATVETDTVYYGVCPECAVGSTTYANADDAETWAATHDAEHHGDNGTSDDDYELFKEARGN